MVRVRSLRKLSPDDLAQVHAFLHEAHILDCAHLNDHLRADLDQGPREGFRAAVATDEHDEMLGYAQASTGNEGFVIDSIVWSRYDGDIDEARVHLLRTLLGDLPADAPVTWWTHDPEGTAPLAASLDMVPGRALLQMRRPLPIDIGDPIDVRPFVVGVDEPAWLEVNNAAFAWHGEQGGWDLATVEQREREPWFRADGFLIHEIEGRMAAFCWTKLHATDGEPLVGEIYVIAVHPDFHGRGLGRALTLAGLGWLQSAGAEEAMLYVDATNTSAVHLYETLGFEVSHIDQAYVRNPEGLPP